LINKLQVPENCLASDLPIHRHAIVVRLNHVFFKMGIYNYKKTTWFLYTWALNRVWSQRRTL